jgi:hypothetical protein
MGWRRRRHAAQTTAAWHAYAVEIYRALSAGHRPEPKRASDLPMAEPVLLDTTMTWACYYGIDITPTPTLWPVPNGLGAMVACAAIARAQARRAADRAAAASAPQWRDHTDIRVLVTTDATWCCIHGTWQAHPHTALTGYWLDGDTAILHATEYAPRALTGPAAWVHAVLLAYLHPPTPDWRHAPWLDAIRDQLSQ